MRGSGCAAEETASELAPRSHTFPSKTRENADPLDSKPFLRPTISLDTPLGHTAPIMDGGVHGEIEGGARPGFLAEEDGRGAPRAAGRRSRSGLPGSRDHRCDGGGVAGPVRGQWAGRVEEPGL
jgi:hypothetical protein